MHYWSTVEPRQGWIMAQATDFRCFTDISPPIGGSMLAQKTHIAGTLINEDSVGGGLLLPGAPRAALA